MIANLFMHNNKPFKCVLFFVKMARYILGVSYYGKMICDGKSPAEQDKGLLRTIAKAYGGAVNFIDVLEPKMIFDNHRKLREARNELVAAFQRGHLNYHSIHPVRIRNKERLFV